MKRRNNRSLYRWVFGLLLLNLASFPLEVFGASMGTGEAPPLPTIDAPTSLSPAERARAERERAQLEKNLAESKSQAAAAEQKSKATAAELKMLQEKAARLEQERDEANRLVKEANKGKEGLATKLKSTQAELAQSELKIKAKDTPSSQATPPVASPPSSTSTSTAGSALTDPTTDMEFVSVPGGCFQMGDTFGDGSNGSNDEKPVHEVCVDGFSLGKYEVTQGEWEKVMGSNPSRFNKGPRYPVEQVSWTDVQKFISELNKQSEKQYRLPTEAEWEYAARSGGKKVRFGTGKDTIGPNEANFNSTTQEQLSYSRIGKYRYRTVQVGMFTPNDIGLYDMAGNVWELVNDRYESNYYQSSPKDNPQNTSSNFYSYRVNRGGSWHSAPENLRAAVRELNLPDGKEDDLGFRLVLPSSASQAK